MRILILHNRYQQAGGEDAVVRSEKSLLESRGHEVRVMEADNDGILGVAAKVRTAFTAIYSLHSKQLVSAQRNCVMRRSV